MIHRSNRLPLTDIAPFLAGCLIVAAVDVAAIYAIGAFFNWVGTYR